MRQLLYCIKSTSQFQFYTKYWRLWTIIILTLSFDKLMSYKPGKYFARLTWPLSTYKVGLFKGGRHDFGFLFICLSSGVNPTVEHSLMSLCR
jgi:hypothetical protein